MPPSRFNQTSWPADGPHRELLDHLDSVHRRHGCRSLREIGRAIHLSYTRVHDIVRGASLPVDEAQVRALVVGLAGTPGPETEAVADHAAELFVKARRARDELDGPASTRTGSDASALLSTGDGVTEPTADRPPATGTGDPGADRGTTVPVRTARPAGVLIAAAVALVVMVVVATTAVVRFAGSSSSADAAGPESPALTADVAGPSMRVTAENPGGCSPSYLVEVTAQGSDPRIVGNRLWIVSELYADMTRNDPNSLYFAKTPVVLSNGRFTAHIEGNTESGVRNERYLLVASPTDAAHQDLQFSLSSDRAHDGQYPDHRRTRLQLGNTEIATGPDLVQRC